MAKMMSIHRVFLAWDSVVFKNTFFVQWNQSFCSKLTRVCYIIYFNTFSVVPSIINENAKKRTVTLTLVWKKEHLKIDCNCDHQMSPSKSKCCYPSIFFTFLKRIVPIYLCHFAQGYQSKKGYHHGLYDSWVFSL